MGERFDEGDFVVQHGESDPVLIVEVVERHESEPSRDRFVVRYITGRVLSNAPSYLMRRATEDEVVKSLAKHGVHT